VCHLKISILVIYFYFVFLLLILSLTQEPLLLPLPLLLMSLSQLVEVFIILSLPFIPVISRFHSCYLAFFSFFLLLHFFFLPIFLPSFVLLSFFPPFFLLFLPSLLAFHFLLRLFHSFFYSIPLLPSFCFSIFDLLNLLTRLLAGSSTSTAATIATSTGGISISFYFYLKYYNLILNRDYQYHKVPLGPSEIRIWILDCRTLKFNFWPKSNCPNPTFRKAHPLKYLFFTNTPNLALNRPGALFSGVVGCLSAVSFSFYRILCKLYCISSSLLPPLFLFFSLFSPFPE
jgi:hypothetical protein